MHNGCSRCVLAVHVVAMKRIDPQDAFEVRKQPYTFTLLHFIPWHQPEHSPLQKSLVTSKHSHNTNINQFTMCRKLTVICQRSTPYGRPISDHFYTFDDLKVPCIKLGSSACKAAVCEDQNFQNPPTLCAGMSAVSPKQFESEAWLIMKRRNRSRFPPAV